MKNNFLVASALLIAALAHGAVAQTYPIKPVRLISPFAPGGGTDLLGRSIGLRVSEAIGQPVVVDNRPGAGGAIGADMVARAEPDGYTLIVVSSSYAATSAYQRLSYDPVNGVEPIVLIGTTGLVMVVPPKVPVKSLAEFIAYARARPGKLNYASVGLGSITHLGTELFKLQARVDLVHVPYKGGAPATQAAVAGEVDVTLNGMIPALPHIRSGRLRALGITLPKRSSLLPDVPTIGEIVPGYEVVHWYAMWGPKGMPGNIVALWNREVAKVLQDDAMRRRMMTDGLEPAGGPPQEFGDRLRRDVEKWRRVVKDAPIPRPN